MTALVLRGDARALPLPADSVDLVVTSPPYFGLRSYQDGGEHYDGQIGDEPTPTEFVAALLEVTAECMRVLKPSGSLWVNLGDKYASQNYAGGSVDQDSPKYRKSTRPARRATPGFAPKTLMGLPWRYALACVDDLGLLLRAEVIWSKPNGLPESVTDRVRRSHEQWFHFTLNPRYYANMDAIRQAAKPGQSPSALSFSRQGRGTAPGQSMAPHREGRPDQGLHPAGVLPPSVWEVATEPFRVPDHLGVDHFAAFPTEWPRRIINGWSPEQGVVLDPFGGTGTTALVASCLGRTGITVDRSADYCRIARWRTTDRNQRAKVLGLAKVADPAPDQGSLF